MPQSPSWSKAIAVATYSPARRATSVWNALGSAPLSRPAGTPTASRYSRYSGQSSGASSTSGRPRAMASSDMPIARVDSSTV